MRDVADGIESQRHTDTVPIGFDNAGRCRSDASAVDGRDFDIAFAGTLSRCGQRTPLDVRSSRRLNRVGRDDRVERNAGTFARHAAAAAGNRRVVVGGDHRLLIGLHGQVAVDFDDIIVDQRFDAAADRIANKQTAETVRIGRRTAQTQPRDQIGRLDTGQRLPQRSVAVIGRRQIDALGRPEIHIKLFDLALQLSPSRRVAVIFDIQFNTFQVIVADVLENISLGRRFGIELQQDALPLADNIGKVERRIIRIVAKHDVA